MTGEIAPALTGHQSHFTEADFWGTLAATALLVGRPLVRLALQLYYAMRSDDTPAWAKGVILGSLGYLISPLDAVPDFVPVAGFTDDLAVLASAVVTVGLHVRGKVVADADAHLERWFGPAAR